MGVSLSPLEKSQLSALAVFNGPLSSSSTATMKTITTGTSLVSSSVSGEVIAQGQGLAAGPELVSECTINGATPCITPSTMFQALIGSGGGLGVGVGDIEGVDTSSATTLSPSPSPGAVDGSAAWLFNGLSAQGQGLVIVVDQVCNVCLFLFPVISSLIHLIWPSSHLSLFSSSPPSSDHTSPSLFPLM